MGSEMCIRDRAKEIVYKMVEQIDVLTENFSPGTMEGLGFGYDEMSARNPDWSTPRLPASGTPDRTASAAPSTPSSRVWAG